MRRIKYDGISTYKLGLKQCYYKQSIKYNKNKCNLICQINAYAAHKKLHNCTPVYQYNNFWDYFMKITIKKHI